MSSLNKVILIGRVTRDPELRYTTSGKPVASFTLAVDRNRAGQGQERETDFIDCVVWQQNAEFASKYATKGRLVCVDGRIQIRSWEDKESGQKRKAFEIVCNDLRMLDKRDAGSGGGYEGAPAARETVYPTPAHARSGGNTSSPSDFQDDDIPF